jgi:hypothetical protein
VNARALVARLLVAVLAAAALVVAPAAALPLPQAQAADLGQFDPGMIISDGVFYDAGTMSAAQVQQFLDSKGASCSPSAGNTCLKSFRQATTTRGADARCTGTYAGAANETAAQIIAKVAAACGINPQVLLVTLQKEQGLVTATAGRSEAVYRKAMGYGCPDTAACDSQYYGFFNQVYSAAKQFKNYQANPTRYGHRAGMVNQVRFHPNAACGSSAVHIRNQATAGLYNYTPYQPNAAALGAGYGTGDSCSSYGNRNFWNYFTDWFGSTDQRAPIGTVDSVTSPSTGQIRVSGWALDPDTTASIDVHVYVNGKAVTSARANASRPDVGAAYGKGDAHGYTVTVPAASGTHQVCVFAIDSTGGPNPQIGCKSVGVVNQAPIGAVDGVSSPAAASIRVTGWALDPDTTASIKVHVYVDGKYDRQVVASTTRNDVAAAHGKGAAHGYDVTLPASDGNHQVCVYAIDATGGANPGLGCRTVAVNNKAPIGTVDDATSVQGKLRVRGWVLDPDTSDSIRANVYVDGVYATSVLAAGARNDVAAAYGKGAAHGFDATVAAKPGKHTVCVYAIDSAGGANPSVGCKDVTVVNAVPIGGFDAALTGLEQFTAKGWVLDPDTTDSTHAHLYVDGKYATSVRATLSRPDVGAAYGKGDAHGFSVTLPASVGTHEVCLYGIDTWGGSNAKLRCRTVEVNGRPFGALDAATATTAAGGVRVQGWAIDPNTTDPISVHVYVDGVAKKATVADVSRPDVATAHGRGSRHGYDTTVTGLAPGQHEVCAWAIDSFGAAMGGVNPQIGCLSVTVR